MQSYTGLSCLFLPSSHIPPREGNSRLGFWHRSQRNTRISGMRQAQPGHTEQAPSTVGLFACGELSPTMLPSSWGEMLRELRIVRGTFKAGEGLRLQVIQAASPLGKKITPRQGLTSCPATLCTQNHRTVGFGRDLWRSPIPTPLPKQGYLEQAAQDRIQAGFEYLQRRRLSNPSG